METKKLERIILLILILMNLFLLYIVRSDAAAQRRARNETVELLTAMLAENGIEAGQEAELYQSAPSQCTVVRNFEQEEQRIRRLIGKHSSEDLGGSIRYYRSEQGQASLRGTGEFDLLLESNQVERTRSPEIAAAGLFKKAGIELYTEDMHYAPGPDHIDLCCCWKGYPVYNAVLGFDFSPERLDLVSGTLIFSEETSVGAAAPMDSATVLTRFVTLTKTEGIICSRLERLTPGYLMEVTMSGESTLTPVWHIQTDTVELYLNALTGQPETLESAA